MTNKKHFNSLEDEVRAEMIRRKTMYTDGYNEGHWYSTAIAVVFMVVVCGLIVLSV